MKKLIVIGGATATGKTALAIRLAKHFGTEILSADSRQFYREMCIGTAKPTPVELAAAPHHFIDFLSVTNPYSVGDFERDALDCLDRLYEQHEIAIIVGGSGLYLRAVCEGLDTFPAISISTKNAVELGEKMGGLAWLQNELAHRDPIHFSRVDRQNPARLRRALEVCLETGQPYSSWVNQGTKQPRIFQPTYLLLELPRTELYARIETRVDGMIAAGLEDEVRSLLPYRHLAHLKTVGYEEFFDYFDGKMSLEATIDKVKQHSRNYAKRQVTWFAKHGDWRAFHPEDETGIFSFVNTAML